jgi:hypothetical protein
VQQPFLASGRYDILPFLPLFTTLARLIDAPFETFVRSTAAAQARYDGQTVFKAMWSRASVENLAECVARFGAQYYDFGKFSGSVPEPNVMVIEHSDVPAYLFPWYRPMHVSYTAECMRLLGAAEVTANEPEAIPAGSRGGFPLVSTRIELRWRRG